VPWTVLGQSFGGFCTVTYLSFARTASARRSSPAACPARGDADDVYRHTYRTVLAKNAAHYERYPSTWPGLSGAAYLADHDVRLPDGAPLSVQAFQSAGTCSARAAAATRCTTAGELVADDELSDAFLYALIDS